MQQLTPDERAQEAREAWAVFRENRCQHCGGAHARACPRVRRMTWHDNGKIAEVEFWPPDRWPAEHITWPEDMPDDPDA